MSSLLDALAEPPAYDHSHADADVLSTPLNDVAPDTAPEEQPKEDEEMGDLFGEDTNVEFAHPTSDHQAPSAPESRASSPASLPPPEDGLASPDRKRRQALEYEEEEEPNPLIEHRLEASVSIPNVPLPKSSDGQHWVIRMPNFVKVDTKPFHPDTYVGPEHEEDFQGGTHERDMGIKLRVENTVRWRWVKGKDGKDQRQSNAHVVRWSDGSMSLRLGKEYFDINQIIDSSGSAHRQAFGSSQGSQPPPSQSQGSSAKAHGLTYLVAQHKRAEILQAEAAITGFLTLRPTDMQSETHRLVVRAVGQKHSKVARLRMAPDPVVDPEREKEEQVRAAKKTRAPRTDDGGPRRRRSQGTRRRRSGGDMDIWSDDDDEPAYDAYGADDDDGRSPKKRRGAREPEDRRGGDYQPDDFVVADSDEEDAGAHGSAMGAGRKKRGHEDDAEEDVLDKLDAQISQQEAERKRRREEGGEGEEAPEGSERGGEAAMEVESEEEEDEEEFRVRRVGGARKRKAVAGFDEEDE
ncbi:Leo1-like protein-domain-containing protein [Gloeopeniophorella convolvens]|nr:Leo1-like protein-domain-containing protein [Gloeopeniophorella convolvens]